MPEPAIIQNTQTPLTLPTLTQGLQAAGIPSGSTLIVHSSLSKLGWVIGGARTVIQALLHTLGPTGTVMMPTHTANNTEPSNWQNPPVPDSWWPLIREHTPAYDPLCTPTWSMGTIPEQFRTWPGVQRSAHPIGSFAAHGPQAAHLTATHDLADMFGEQSPLDTLYALDGWIVLLGVTHENDTSLHLAEARAQWPGKHTHAEGTAMHVDGKRQWVTFDMLQWDSDDFEQIGTAYEQSIAYQPSRIGMAEVRVLRMRPLVDFAVEWIQTHRG
jgi:aminoglycoside 3-N-acetyltransferase